jgi:2-polyprenyl-3-methyl-5-hydroxy-6-metoxy-1,4-benzoquinol methylase
MNDTEAVRLCPMCRAKPGAWRSTIRKGAATFELVNCIRCRFVYVLNPQRETFHTAQTAPAEVPERARHRQIKRVCDHHRERHLTSDAAYRVVEVGAGWGGLAQVFARDDRYRYVGLEPSADRAAFCRAHGLEVRHGLFDGPGSIGTADAIIFDNVLEHVIDPDGLVGAAVASLREGGLLIVIVPNVRDVRQLNRAWRVRHHWQPHCHINYFSAGDLDRLFARHGLGLRFFGFEAVGGVKDSFELVPRVIADAVGLHLLGLNCYGVKSAS